MSVAWPWAKEEQTRCCYGTGTRRSVGKHLRTHHRIRPSFIRSGATCVSVSLLLSFPFMLRPALRARQAQAPDDSTHIPSYSYIFSRFSFNSDVKAMKKERAPIAFRVLFHSCLLVMLLSLLASKSAWLAWQTEREASSSFRLDPD